MPKKILIAEDDSFLIKMYKLNLGAVEDFAVTVAMNGEEAITQLDAEQPDLLILDILMPKKDGFGVLEHCKEKGYTMPILILTNLSQDVDKEKCMELGAKDYYVKSDMDVDDLVDMVKNCV